MKENNKKTIWLAVSGLDGSGKTTLVDNLEKWLTEKGKTVLRDRLPHDKYLVNKLLNQSEDSYTDRLLFAIDNRIFGTKLKKVIQAEKYDVVLTQRCYLDSFVHGAVQGYSYSWIEDLNRTCELPRTDIIVHMVAEAKTAYSRICNDPDADKFEYPAYMRKQEVETRRAYAECVAGQNTDLEAFTEAIHLYCDTTCLTPDQTFENVVKQLETIGLL